MKKIILLCFMFLSFSVRAYSDEDQVAKNFARALLGSNKAKIALITLKDSRSDKDLSPEELSFFYHPKCKKYLRKPYFIYNNITVMASFCEKLKTNIFLKIDQTCLGPVDKFQPILIAESSIWLVLLNSMYEENGKIKAEDMEDLKGIDEFDFINRDTFYKISMPEAQNAVCLKWVNVNNFPKPLNYTYSEMVLIEDIKILSNIFYESNISPINAIEKVNGAISKLKTGLGVKIAKQIVLILEDKIIKEEFKPKSAQKLDFQKIENRLQNAK